MSPLGREVIERMAGAEDGSTRAVGPYLLQRTLGKGQTGNVCDVWGGGHVLVGGITIGGLGVTEGLCISENTFWV